MKKIHNKQHLPGHCCLPTEKLQGFSAAVGGHVREGQPINQQMKVESGQGGGDWKVSFCRDNGSDAALQCSGTVGYLQPHNLRLWQLQVWMESGRKQQNLTS